MRSRRFIVTAVLIAVGVVVGGAFTYRRLRPTTYPASVFTYSDGHACMRVDDRLWLADPGASSHREPDLQLPGTWVDLDPGRVRFVPQDGSSPFELRRGDPLPQNRGAIVCAIE